MALTTNLVSYWKLDESSGNAADSHGSNTLTNVLTVAYAAAKINNGADFEATTANYLSIADATQSGLDITADISVAFWVKLESLNTTNNTDAFVSKFLSTGAQRAYFFKAVSGTSMQFSKSIDGTNTAGQLETKSVAWTYTTATWYHLVYAYTDSTKIVQFFVNGSQQGTDQTFTNSGIFNSSEAFLLGANLGDPEFLDGIMDEVGIWNRPLTAAEASSLYNGGAGLAYPFSSGPANLKSLDTNVKANIKSYNTNVLANIKSIDTNV